MTVKIKPIGGARDNVIEVDRLLSSLLLLIASCLHLFLVIAALHQIKTDVKTRSQEIHTKSSHLGIHISKDEERKMLLNLKPISLL